MWICNFTSIITCFNTQPPEGGWIIVEAFFITNDDVSTRSRPKAAGKKHYSFV